MPCAAPQAATRISVRVRVLRLFQGRGRQQFTDPAIVTIHDQSDVLLARDAWAAQLTGAVGAQRANRSHVSYGGACGRLKDEAFVWNRLIEQ